MSEQKHQGSESGGSWLDSVFRFCLENKLIVFLLLIAAIGWGILVAPFDWELRNWPRDPVPVDAIPDLGENQQIVFTRWSGRSPRDVEDQITAPLTSALMGISGLKTVRSFSYFGYSTIYLIFREDVEFYWSRSRVLEKLNSLPSRTLPPGIQPTLGPDATGLGQVFWYTLEGRDEKGRVIGGWNTFELRRIQDWYVRYALQSAEGVAEVSSVGGFIPEYQVDVDPDKLRIHRVSLQDVYNAVRMSNQEVGARTIEINRVEYVVRVRGYIKKIAEIENTVLRARKGAPLYIKDVATVALGPAPRRGVLDKDGAEVVGGVVVASYGSNPLQVIKHVKAKMAEISKGLPRKTLPDGRISQVTIIPFYDRTTLIKETLFTLEEAITLEVLVTILVIIAMMMHLRTSLLISGLLPLAVLLSFIAMKLFHVDANIVALSGIAIAIGTMVDMGIVLSENIVQHLDDMKPGERTFDAILRATSEVGTAVLTSVSTTIVSFLPVFTLQAAEGKLFRPLAYTKTFSLLAALLLALFILPPLAHLFLRGRRQEPPKRSLLRDAWLHFSNLLILMSAAWLALFIWWWLGVLVALISVYRWGIRYLPGTWYRISQYVRWFGASLVLVFAGTYLVVRWMPLGHEHGYFFNGFFVFILMGGFLGGFEMFRRHYGSMLRWCLAHKKTFLLMPFLLILLGANIWLGFEKVFAWIPWSASYLLRPSDATLAKNKETRDTADNRIRQWIRHLGIWQSMHQTFPGLKKEFMPSLDEGSFLLMPTTMPHASIGEATDVLQKLDRAIRAIPEVSMVVGKIGRAESALDPAPISMLETVIHYKPKYRVMSDGSQQRQWRKHIQSPKDIWNEIVKATQLLGTTSAPHLQPIAARLVMLQSGMRAPMGIKVKGPDLPTIERVALQLEKYLKEVPQIEPATVLADRVVGKPYLEFEIDRNAIERYGLKLTQVQEVIKMAIGGSVVTTTVEGRERYSVVVRYKRELRNDLQSLQKIMVPTPTGSQIPLLQIASLQYIRGPMVIRSEDTFLVAYVIFDRKEKYSEVETVEAATKYLEAKIKNKDLRLPDGVSYRFSGSYENQIRAEKRLMIVLPLALFLIFLILYLQFKNTLVTAFIFSGILVAWSGGFLLIWLYQQPWFLNVSFFGLHLREIFSIHGFHLSVAVWVGFIALFGIATDDGVVIATYLQQTFHANHPQSIEAIRETTVIAGERRILPCLMTTATTLLALLPVLSSTGRGADIMIPMAIPVFGGMMIELLTLFVVPVLYCGWQEMRLLRQQKQQNKWWKFWRWGTTGWILLLTSAGLSLPSSHALAQSSPPPNQPPSQRQPQHRPSPTISSPSETSKPVSETLPRWPQRQPQPIDLPALLTKSQKYNPTLVRLRRQVQELQQREKQAGPWPDLEIGIEGSNFPLPTFDPTQTPMSGIQYSVSQRFPILRRLHLQRKLAQLTTAMGKTWIQEQTVLVAFQVKRAVYELSYLRRSWEIQQELYQLTGQSAEVARTKYAVGQASQQNYLQAWTLQAQIRNRVQGILAQERIERYRLQQLLGGHATQGQPLAIQDPADPPTFSVLLTSALAKRGIVQRWTLATQQAQAMMHLARVRYWPDVMLKLGIRQRFPNSMDTGNPFISLGVQVALPTWGNSARHGDIKGAMARHQVAASQLRETQEQIREQLRVQLTQVEQYNQQIRIYREQIIPLAQQTYQSALSSYQVNKLDFLTLLSNLRTLYQEKLQLDRLRTLRAVVIAQIVAISGQI